MAATHASVDCIRKLQEEHPKEMRDLDGVEKHFTTEASKQLDH